MPYFCVPYEFKWDAAARLGPVAVQAKLTSDFSAFFPAKTVLLCYTRAANSDFSCTWKGKTHDDCIYF